MSVTSFQQVADMLCGWFQRTAFGRQPSYYLLNPAAERRVLRVRRHWAVLLKVILSTVGILISVFVLSLVVNPATDNAWLVYSWLWYIAVAAPLHLAWKMLEWWTELIIVTDKQLIIVSGIIVRRNSTMPITMMTDMSFMRPLAGQVLGYGTLRVESAGQKRDLKTMAYLPRPEEVFMAISELIFGEKRQPRSHNLERPRPSRHGRWVSRNMI